MVRAQNSLVFYRRKNPRANNSFSFPVMSLMKAYISAVYMSGMFS